MTDRLRWGVLGVARIATQKVIPAMQRGTHTIVAAIASRDLTRAERAAADLGIATAYASYEALLADPAIDAVYIPLPNHLHVPWSIRAIDAGKHVLCEKPIGLDAAEARALADAARRRPSRCVMEAFMYRFHPQWAETRAIVERGEIGEVRAIHTAFAYFNDDPANVRNRPDIGGGALMDIGCYGVSLARFVLGREPVRVSAVSDIDPRFGTDRLTSALLDFGGAVATFTCSTQIAAHQRVEILGTTGRVAIDVPFNVLPDRPGRLWITTGDSTRERLTEPCNQYTVQGDRFSLAAQRGDPAPTPIDDAVANMRIIDAVRASAAARARMVEPGAS
jgi:predicted dehydrogenase